MVDHTKMTLTLEKFDCDGDPSSVGARWDRWKRALHIYLEAAGVTSSAKKCATLLHFGGLELQEIFHNIPNETGEPDGNKDPFKTAISKLDAYFAPKQSKVYERHLFRQLKQEHGEKMGKFIIRLRQQAQKCQFKDTEDQMIDQIVEKGVSTDLRKKILKTGDAMTLDQIIVEANILETVSRQMEEYASVNNQNRMENTVVHRVLTAPRHDSSKHGSPRYNNPRQECGRCGNRKHNSQDAKCPARDKECLRCGLKGHFRQYCRTRQPIKRKSGIDSNRRESNKRFKPNTQTVNQVSQQDKEDINYVFYMDGDASITCKIGGIELDMLVDSGCKHNLITDKTWETLRTNRRCTYTKLEKPNKQFLAYGSDIPLILDDCFEAELQIGGKPGKATFYVIRDGTRNLLGRITATSMGVLKIGLDIGVNHVKVEAFPKLKDVVIKIPIDSSVLPVSQPFRRIPIPLEEKVEKKIEELISHDIIEKVNGPSKWVSPMVPVLKENGEIRLCVDMRRANKAIRRENHPLPTMDKILPKIGKAKYFSKLDIKDAFHQVELHEESRDITTFITSKGLYRYKRLMFGITCAPELFQKTLERLLLGCEGALNFIDDILVYGKNIEEHDMRLKKVMKVLHDNNAVLKKEKCIYRVTKVQFLGHELTEEGVRPLSKYIATIQKFRPPTTKGELQSFLGLVNFVGKWIPNLATATEPLKEVLRNSQKGEGSNIQGGWGGDQQTAFEVLKSSLSNIPTLGYYNVESKTMVVADASPVGLGGVLIQMENNEPRIIAYGNKTLSECERRYCQTEKEALALVWAVEHFHIFLYGKHFDLITDHKPLEVIFGPKSKPCARIERWIMRLQSYSYTVIYRSGKSNVADPLSRLCVSSEKDSRRPTVESHVHQIVQYTRPVAVPLEEIVKYSNEDPEISKVKEGLYDNKWAQEVKTFKVFQTELCVYDGILLRGTRIVIPEKLRKQVLSAAHEGHPGIVAMKARLRTKVWWPGCDKDAENLVKSCRGCTLVSTPTPPTPLKRRELPSEAWVDIGIDLMGPLPSGDHIFVAVDYYSRYKEVKVLRKIGTAEIVSHLKEIFSRLGNPVSITADNGRQFCGQEFKSFCKERNITLFNTIPYWPQQNGEVERQNRDILKRLKISVAEKKDWRDSLQEYLVMYNSTPHSTTGKTPSELFYKRLFRDKIPMMGDIANKLDNLEVRDKDKVMKETGKEYADERRNAKENYLEAGDKVYVKNMNKQNKLSLNFEPTTHTVERTNGGDVEVRNDETGQTYRRNVVHLKKVQGEWEVLNKQEEENEKGREESVNDDQEAVDQE